MSVLVMICRIAFAASMFLLGVYAVRHFWFGVYRLNLVRPIDYSELEGCDLPRISVIVPMHNEEDVASDVLDALANSDYDADRLEVLAVDDRSTDGTGGVIDDFAARYAVVRALHRSEGNGGKAGALDFATREAKGDVLMVFDADYVPGRGILKMLAAPFADPRVAAVMGRVVPNNAAASLMSGLLALERAAGYQVGQQARFNMGLVPQFGGTVGGVRTSALRAVGGWNARSLTEDTDLTCRLAIAGWKIAYVNRAECYEQVPQSWEVRRKQLRRWVIGHTECLHRYWWRVTRSKALSWRQRTDLLLMLACYLTAPVLLVGWAASLLLFFVEQPLPVTIPAAALLVIGCQLFANQASFFELAAATALDRDRLRALLLPLTILNFFASTAAICAALASYYGNRLRGRSEFNWQRTTRYRTNGNGNGHGGNGNGHAGNGNGNGNGRPRVP